MSGGAGYTRRGRYINLIAEDTSIDEVNLRTSTGEIHTHFFNVLLNTSNPFLDTSTGSIHATFDNINYIPEFVEWVIHTSTGSIDVNIIQDQIVNNTNIYYGISTSTGSIDCFHEFNPEIGYLVDASVSLGNINAYDQSVDDNFNYLSENYNSAWMIFDIYLSTSTGSITIEN